MIWFKYDFIFHTSEIKFIINKYLNNIKCDLILIRESIEQL